MRKTFCAERVESEVIERFKAAVPEGRGLTIRLALMSAMELFAALNPSDRRAIMLETFEKYEAVNAE